MSSVQIIPLTKDSMDKFKTSDDQTVFFTPTGAKLGAKGKVANTDATVGELLAKLPKGDARKLRKGLRAKGNNRLAAARRAA